MSTQQTTTSVEPVWQTGGLICGLDWHDRYIYLAVGPRLMIVDAADLIHPVIVGQSDPLPGSLARLVVHGDLAFACTDGLLHVFDVSDRTYPRAIGRCAAQVQAAPRARAARGPLPLPRRRDRRRLGPRQPPAARRAVCRATSSR